MSDSHYIHLKSWDSASTESLESDNPISIYTLARSMSSENFAALLDDYLNLGGKGFHEGKEVGLQLRFTHRTLQRLAVCFAFGLIAGLSEQEYTDPRNETAILTAKKVVLLMEAGELPLGLYI
jgi:hypothetical protein